MPQSQRWRLVEPRFWTQLFLILQLTFSPQSECFLLCHTAHKHTHIPPGSTKGHIYCWHINIITKWNRQDIWYMLNIWSHFSATWLLDKLDRHINDCNHIYSPQPIKLCLTQSEGKKEKLDKTDSFQILRKTTDQLPQSAVAGDHLFYLVWIIKCYFFSLPEATLTLKWILPAPNKASVPKV